MRLSEEGPLKCERDNGLRAVRLKFVGLRVGQA